MADIRKGRKIDAKTAEAPGRERMGVALLSRPPTPEVAGQFRYGGTPASCAPAAAD